MTGDTIEAPQALPATSVIGGVALAGRAGTEQVYTCHRGVPHGAWYASCTNTGWSYFSSANGGLASAPAITAAFEQNIDIFALHSSGEIIQTWREGGGWAA